METLVVVAQHRNQFHSRSKAQGHARFGPSSPSRDFRGINCRTFQTGTGILPTPLKSYPSSSPSLSPSPKSPSSPQNHSASSDYKPCGKIATPKSAPIAISGRACRKERTFSDEHVVLVPGGGSVFFSELWAGPTYSNSPPPSSLPIPKFSVRPKRTVSLDLPGSSPPEIEMHPVAKSVPASPRWEHSPSSARDLFANADSATKTLRRILNLNLDDD